MMFLEFTKWVEAHLGSHTGAQTSSLLDRMGNRISHFAFLSSSFPHKPGKLCDHTRPDRPDGPANDKGRHRKRESSHGVDCNYIIKNYFEYFSRNGMRCISNKLKEKILTFARSPSEAEL